MTKPKPIKHTYFRATARALFLKRDKVLSMEGLSSTKKDRFFGIPGGTVELGESSRETLIREMKEELGANIKIKKYLGVIENIFFWKGKTHHEYVFIYAAEFSDKSFYKKEKISGIEDTGQRYVLEWMPLKQFRSRRYRLVPLGILKLVNGKEAKEKHMVAGRR